MNARALPPLPRLLALVIAVAGLVSFGVQAQTAPSTPPGKVHPTPHGPVPPAGTGTDPTDRSERPSPPVRSSSVRFEGLTLGQKLSDLPQCKDDGSSTTPCYGTSFDGIKAPDLSPSVHTVVLYNLPAFLPPVPAGQTPPTAQESDRQHRGLASVINGRIEEIKIMIPSSRVKEAARQLTKTFPHTVFDEDAHMIVGDHFAIGFGHAPEHVVIGLLSQTFVETLQKDAADTSDDDDGVTVLPGQGAPGACPLPSDGPGSGV